MWHAEIACLGLGKAVTYFGGNSTGFRIGGKSVEYLDLSTSCSMTWEPDGIAL